TPFPEGSIHTCGRASLPDCGSVRREGIGRVVVSRAFSTTSSQQPSHALHFGSPVCCACETTGNNNTVETRTSVFIGCSSDNPTPSPQNRTFIPVPRRKPERSIGSKPIQSRPRSPAVHS